MGSGLDQGVTPAVVSAAGVQCVVSRSSARICSAARTGSGIVASSTTHEYPHFAHVTVRTVWSRTVSLARVSLERSLTAGGSGSYSGSAAGPSGELSLTGSLSGIGQKK